jgi:hypothetical protein
MKIKIVQLTASEKGELLVGFRSGESHCFRMRCRAVLLIKRVLLLLRTSQWVKLGNVESIREKL